MASQGRNPIPQCDRDRIARMARQGFSKVAVAKATGVSVKTVRKVLSEQEENDSDA